MNALVSTHILNRMEGQMMYRLNGREGFVALTSPFEIKGIFISNICLIFIVCESLS